MIQSSTAKDSVTSVETLANGIDCKTEHGRLEVSVAKANIVRIRYTREQQFSDDVSPICLPQKAFRGNVDVVDASKLTTVSSNNISVSLDKVTGALSFMNDQGEILLRETEIESRICEQIEIKKIAFDLKSAKNVKTVDGGRLEAKVKEISEGTRAWTIQQNFEWQDGEALYGLGSHEENVLNLRGTMQYLYQQNMKAVVPVLISSKGYAILFNAQCEMEFHDDDQGSFVKLDAVKELDYYIIYGPDFDRIVAGYRELTGSAPMLPRWAFGYCQSKERYKNQRELIEIVEEYRKRNLPLDLIIQDWQYWPSGWGGKKFDRRRYQDPTAMCERIHELNAKIMISIWPSIRGNQESKDMQKKGFMLSNNVIYDAYTEDARAEYWKYANDGLFKHGIDSWWCDCTEPVEADWNGKKKLSPKQRRDKNTTAQRNLLGRNRVSSYSLLHSKGIYENQRSTTDDKRVVNLTRSAYAGQQRYGTITWSGDIAARWEVLAQQIPCGLNFTATGCPYWTNDIGAFFVKKKSRWFWCGQFQEGCDDLGYRELYTRWFQYGAFLPMLRSHGTDTPREIWRFGKPGEMFYDTLVKYLHLRYTLLPYIYSLAGRTTQDHYTMMRALAFDFREDPDALDVKTQYMFGPAFMVCPITRPMYYGPDSKELGNTRKSRQVYLPKGADWYDYWTGVKYDGGQTISAKAPLETMPLYVRAGSIVPMGPVVQYTDEKLDAEWTIRIYPGADGEFTVYEDAGDGYGYEKGEFTSYKLMWNDAKSTLSISDSNGSFPRMVNSRKLKIVLMQDETATHDMVYTGKAIIIKRNDGQWF